MGCGISTLDAENAARGEHVNGDRRAMAPLIVESGVEGESLHGNSNNNNKMKPLGDEEAKDNDGSMKEKSVVERNDMKVEARAREIGGKEKRSSGDGKCCAENNVEEEFENRDDKLTVGPGSPSFREYCNDHCGNRREDSLIMNSKLMNEGSVVSNKLNNMEEHEKKEGKGKARGRKKLIDFACYHGSTVSHAKASSKIVGKTA